MSDGKLPLYLDHEEAEIIFDCLKQREDLLNKAVHCCKDDAKSYKSIMKQLDIVTLNLGILFGNAKKGPWTPYSQDCRRSRHD